MFNIFLAATGIFGAVMLVIASTAGNRMSPGWRAAAFSSAFGMLTLALLLPLDSGILEQMLTVIALAAQFYVAVAALLTLRGRGQRPSAGADGWQRSHTSE